VDRLTPDLVFRDPYLLDFLGLKDTYSERDLEAAIVRDWSVSFWSLAPILRSSHARSE
jgi:predicted nuclease of restriction endonuclease-like (RecB) superfamily